MKKVLIISFLSILFFSSCEFKNENSSTIIKDTTKVSQSEYLVSGALWYQTSAEAKAIYHQSFNLAKLMLDKNLKESKSDKPKAIITDIDETILNNSPSNVRLIKTGELYSRENWTKWVNAGIAEALPGAVDFCNYAKDAGVTMIYLSNRRIQSLDITMKNMTNEGFPFVNKENYFLKSTTSDKTARRDSVLANYDVILYMGDNLCDFSEDFDHRKDNFGGNVVEENKEMFGSKFIVFPNPMYGVWERAAYNDTWKTPDSQKDSLRKAALKDNF